MTKYMKTMFENGRNGPLNIRHVYEMIIALGESGNNYNFTRPFKNDQSPALAQISIINLAQFHLNLTVRAIHT